MWKGHVFSNRQILMKVTGIQTNQGIRHFIHRLEKKELIKQIEIPSIEEENKKYSLVGITSHGMALAGKINRRGVEVSKIKHSQLLHKFLCQRVHLKAIDKGWKYVSGRWLESKWVGHKGVKRPDGMIIKPDNTKIAIEAERTVKSKCRYQQVIIHYLKMIKKGDVDKVWYVMPNEKTKHAVEQAMRSIRFLTITSSGEKQTYLLNDDIWGKFMFTGISP